MNCHDKCPLGEPSDRNATRKALPMLFFWLFRKLSFTPIQWWYIVCLHIYVLTSDALEIAQLIVENIKFSLYKMRHNENDMFDLLIGNLMSRISAQCDHFDFIRI